MRSMNYYAHSPKDGIPAQSYQSHIWGVQRRIQDYVNNISSFVKHDGRLFAEISELAATFHDLGKLDGANQDVLSGLISSRALPHNHVDAGTAYLLDNEHLSIAAASIVQAHHVGFPNFISEMDKDGEKKFRDARELDDMDKIRQLDLTNEILPEIEAIHKDLIGTVGVPEQRDILGDQSVFLRIALSCLVDADHTDTAVNFRKYPDEAEAIPLRPVDRLAQLDKYVKELGSDGEHVERNALRSEMYDVCKATELDETIVSCDSPVGSGKTTAIMAHLLTQAARRGLRRIFVILPYTNIIEQSVDIYRRALVLPGEMADEVVAEIHHRADFENEDIRHLTALWKAPIIVTTAVAFFETLASNTPATLRRLHELPGSAIFVDESHAALPVKLIPLAWRWMNIYADEWGCYWVLASGSLNRFWDIKELSQQKSKPRQVPEIISTNLRNRLAKYENNRISYKNDLCPRTEDDLANWVTSFNGPRLVIVNTVQSAAVLANHFASSFGRDRVEHISTALTPTDRGITLERIKGRLKLKGDSDWTLIATSCVEAGVNLSFRTGFRELSSLSSLLQAAGRVNREGSHAYSEMWTFCLAQNNMLNSNPTMRDSSSVLRKYIEGGVTITPDLSTNSISEEIKLGGLSSKYEKMITDEELKCFPLIEAEFKVIASDTRPVIVDKAISNQVCHGNIDWRGIQKNSVQIAKYKLDELRTPMIYDGLYEWNLKYDNFIGYMAGVIQSKKFETDLLMP